jgi:phosphoribosylamine--glycine ligase
VLPEQAKTFEQARENAYSAVEKIDFTGGFYRKDIGWRELKRLNKNKQAS